MTLRLAGPLLLVGAGKMGGALLEGWLKQGLDPATVFIQDPVLSETMAAIAAECGIVANDAPELPEPPTGSIHWSGGRPAGSISNRNWPVTRKSSRSGPGRRVTPATFSASRATPCLVRPLPSPRSGWPVEHTWRNAS